MSESARVLSAVGATSKSADKADSDLCWRNVIKINLEARQQASSEESASSTYALSSIPSAGSKKSHSTNSSNTKSSAEVIVVSDGESSPSPGTGDLTLVTNSNMNKLSNNTHLQTLPDDLPDAEVQALRELLHKEEKKLSVLKTIHGLQGTSVATTVAAKPSSSIQGSALNKTSGRSSGGGGSGRNSPNLRAQQKHSIVVVPGNQSSQVSGGSGGGGTNAAGISSRLQQLVDNIAVDQALTSCSERLQPNAGSGGKTPSNKLVSVSTPPVPGLTNSNSQKHHFITSSSSSDKHYQLTSANSVTKLKPKIIATTTSITNRSSSHEIITISDSPMGKKPPPLLSSSRVPTATTNGSIQVPTISSSMYGHEKKTNLTKAAESSRLYREYLLKQAHTKKNFQKQIERKMVVAPYPKTFRQVWPLIPVHDTSFVRNFGLESVMHHFDPQSKALQEKSNSKVKPICNQCGCDFASAWQIRKSNSKQLLLCEACDFQNLKILQRSKLSNQLKELLESIKSEQTKFIAECEETRKQILEHEKQAAVSPPPLTSQLSGHVANATAATQRLAQRGAGGGVSQGGRTMSHNNQGNTNRYHVVKTSIAKQSQSRVNSNGGASNQQHTMVTPSVLNQRIQPAAKAEVGTKRLAPAGQVATPPSKVAKPGSVLDLTLNRLSEQLIKRKLDEQRQECQLDEEVDPRNAAAGEGENIGREAIGSPTSPNTLAGRRARSRRKGTPKHKRLLSGSSE